MTFAPEDSLILQNLLSYRVIFIVYPDCVVIEKILVITNLLGFKS